MNSLICLKGNKINLAFFGKVSSPISTSFLSNSFLHDDFHNLTSNSLVSFSRFNFSKKQEKNVQPSLKKLNEIKASYELQMKKNDELKAKLAQIREMYKDLNKDIEHIKKRHNIEKEKMKQFSITAFAKDLLEVHDTFSQALSHLKPLHSTNNDNLFNSFFDSITMVNNALTRIFLKHQIKEFKPNVGEKFDPAKHEAIYEYFDETKKSGTVGKVLYSGFMIGDRILRPAKVGVVKLQKI